MAIQLPEIPGLNERPIDRVLQPFQRFARIEASGGLLLITAAIVALIWANLSPESYHDLWHTHVTFSFGHAELDLSLHHFINDGLMAIFFFVVGLEIKRELLLGELSSFRQASMPIAAAIGGMVVPALMYLMLNPSGDHARGWAIPMATDIAFALGALAVLGSRVPVSLKVFLAALAIVDDMGAVLVIAFFYSGGIDTPALMTALGMLALAFIFSRLGTRAPLVYAAIGLVMWIALLKSGVHATIGGVLLAMTIPLRVRIPGAHFTTFARKTIDEFEAAGGNEDDIVTNRARQSAVHGLEQACEFVQTPLNRLEHGLHPLCAFLILPVFALANAGVPVVGFGDAFTSSVGIGIILGLLVGKPVGVVLATFIAVRLRLGDLPPGSTWRQILGLGFLAGIGFTMSVFIANLGFGKGPVLELAKASILLASVAAGVIGYFILRTAKPRP